MDQLINKRVLLCVTGGIAAYKSAELVRLFKNSGSDVRVLMTKSAQEFITPLTMQALSGNPIHSDLLDPGAEAAMGHIELARWSDIIVIAPFTADSIAKLALGRGDDLLSAVALSTDAPIFVAPAMNQAMWRDGATQNNISTLAEKNFIFIGPDIGTQACGDTGPGRMTEPSDIIQQVSLNFSKGLLAGKKILITAGPTREMIDPVRFISNRSSGKMGFALAEAACDEGAFVSLISGPVNLPTPERIFRHDVETAKQMYDKVNEMIDEIDIFIATAAVCDIKPSHPSNQKIKKQQILDANNILLEENPDIVASVKKAHPNKKVIGFAAETENVLDNAKLKLSEKELDLIIANDVSNAEIGFDSDDNEVHLISEKNSRKINKSTKEKVSREIIKYISDNLK